MKFDRFLAFSFMLLVVLCGVLAQRLARDGWPQGPFAAQEEQEVLSEEILRNKARLAEVVALKQDCQSLRGEIRTLVTQYQREYEKLYHHPKLKSLGIQVPPLREEK